MNSDNIHTELEKLKAGDHLCFIYETEEEHNAVLVPYLRRGLEKNEKVIYAFDSRSSEDIERLLKNDGLNVDAYIKSGQLNILSSQQTHLKGGRFDPDRVIQMLASEIKRAEDEGYSALRVTGETSWALRNIPGQEKLIDYEIKLNNFFPGKRAIALCQYDRALFKPEVLLDVLAAHPLAVIGRESFDNIYYMPPEEAYSKHVASYRLERRIKNLKSFKDKKLQERALADEASRLLAVEEESRKALLSMVEDLRRAEEQMKESELHFRTLANSGRALIWTSGTDKKCNYFNQPWLDFTGRTMEQELGDGWTESVHPEDLERCIKTYNEAFERCESFSMVYRLRRKDGVYRWVQDDGMPRYDLSCSFKGYIGHCLDITELKEAEEQISFIKRLLEAVQDINQAIIKETFSETDSLLAKTCRSLHETVGYPVVLAGQVRKKPYRVVCTSKEGLKAAASEDMLFSPDDPLYKDSPVQAALSQREVFICRDLEDNAVLCPFIKEALKKGCVCCMGIPLSVHGDVAGILIICSDNLPAFEAEERAILEELANDVSLAWEAMAAEGERKLLTEQLVRAEKLAAVGELIAGVAHEINNPLTGIVGFAELMLLEDKNRLDPDTRKGIENIYKSSERICRIVANLLRFSRRETPMRKNISVGEVVDRVLNIRDYEMLVRNIELKKNYQPDTPRIMADPSQLEQVFLNLINNAEYAIRETGTKGVLSINIFTEGLSEGGRNVVVEISDTGTGVPDSIINKLFDPFFTTKPVGKGTGLGLSVSYGIVKEHGGEISVSNKKEGGAVFKIRLPVAEKTDVK